MSANSRFFIFFLFFLITINSCWAFPLPPDDNSHTTLSNLSSTSAAAAAAAAAVATTSLSSASSRLDHRKTNISDENVALLLQRHALSGSYDALAEINQSSPILSVPMPDIELAGALRWGVRKPNPEFTGDTSFYSSVKETDKAFFDSMHRPIKKRDLTTMFLMSLLGLGVPQANIPMINESLGTVLKLQIDGPSVLTLGSIVTISTTPEFMWQYGSLGLRISRVFQNDIYQDQKISLSYLHKGAYAFVLLSSILRILPRAAYFIALEGSFLYFSIPATCTFLPAEIDRSYDVGSTMVDQFIYPRYKNHTSQLHLRILLEATDKCMERIMKDPTYTEEVYKTLTGPDSDNILRSGAVLLFQSFLRNISNPELNFLLDINNIKPPSLKSGMVSPFANYLTYGSMPASFAGTYYALQHLIFKNASLTAQGFAIALASTAMVAQAFLEFDSTWEFSANLDGIFSSDSYNFLRKPAQVKNFIMGCLYIFPSVYLAMKGLESSYTAITVLLLIPYAIKQFAYYWTYLNAQSQSMITHIARLKRESLSYSGKINYIKEFIRQYKTQLQRMDPNKLNEYFTLVYNDGM